MPRISTLFRKLATRLDDVARLAENHDGLAESAIRAARDRLERASRALDVALRESTRIEAALSRQRLEEQRFREQARTEASEAEALEALRSAHRLRACAERLERQRRAYDETTRRLRAEVSRIEAHLVSLERTRHLLRAREARAEALHAVVGQGPGDGLKGALERWEEQVSNAEASGNAAFDVARICDVETRDEADLLAELAELRRNR